jgi:hypothetical protein
MRPFLGFGRIHQHHSITFHTTGLRPHSDLAIKAKHGSGPKVQVSCRCEQYLTSHLAIIAARILAIIVACIRPHFQKSMVLSSDDISFHSMFVAEISVQID